MSVIARNWPTIRQIAYGIGAVVLGGSALAGWITADQAAAWTDQLSEILGAAALLVAGLYVKRPAADLGDGTNVPVQYSVQYSASDLDDVIADARRRLSGGGHG